MLPNALKKALARIVLASYATQVFAPVVYACEDIRPESPYKRFRDTSPPGEGRRQQSLRETAKFQLDTQPFDEPSQGSEAPKAKTKLPLPSPDEPQNLPTLSVRLQTLSSPENPEAGYRLSLEQTRLVGGLFAPKIRQTDYAWSREFSLEDFISAPKGVSVNHPWMAYLGIHLSETGALTVQSLPQEGDRYQSYNYIFATVEDLRLTNVLTQGALDVQQANRIFAQKTVFARKGIRLKARTEIQTRSTDSENPTLLGSDTKIQMKTAYLDNEGSQITAPVIKGRLGRPGQKGASLDNTQGVIRAKNVLSLIMGTEAFNEEGVIDATSGTTHVYTPESFLNTNGFVGGKNQCDVTVRSRFQNRSGQVGSAGNTTLTVHTLTNRDQAQVWGHNLTLLGEQVTTDETSRLAAKRRATLATKTLHQESAIDTPSLHLTTLQGLDLAAWQYAAQDICLQSSAGILAYKPNSLKAGTLLSLTSPKIPLVLTSPLKTPGAVEVAAPEIDNPTTVAAQGEVTLKASSPDVPYPVRNEGDILSGTRGVTVEAQGFSHTKGRLGMAGDFTFEGQNLRLRSHTAVGGTLPIVATGEQDIDYSQLVVEGLLQLTLPASHTKITTPIRIGGKLELGRDGDSPETLHILADLIAKKGIKVHLPEAPLVLGAEPESQPMVKVQTENGFLELQSRSLDIPKAQLFARTGMRWEVLEKQVHIGRGVVRNRPIVTTFKIDYPRPGWAEELLLWIEVISYTVMDPHGRIATYDKYYISQVACIITHTWYCQPFSQPNGTIVVSEGSFVINSPEGVLIDQAEVLLQDWQVTTQEPVQNAGGKISVQKDILIHNSETLRGKHSILQNVILTNTINGGDYCYPTFTYPFSNRGEIIIGGDLKADILEDLGGFISIGGEFLGSLKQTDFIKKFNNNGAYTRSDRLNPYIQDKFSSEVSIGKALIDQKALASNQKTEDRQFEGILQSPIIFIDFDGTVTVGKLANYRRPPTPPFQQMKKFIDVQRPTALYQPVMDAPTPWINQPTVPLHFSIPLPPAVGFGPEGLFLLGERDKLLLHPLQEIDALPSVFSSQLRRGYLDADHPDTLATYVMGRHQAYDLYKRFFAPKALEGVTQPQPPSSNPERALAAFNTEIAERLTPEEMEKVKFMMLYYKTAYDDGANACQTVYLPTSWLSRQYDDPKVRNPDGGVFGDMVIFKGKPGAKLHCASHIHGEKLLGINVPHTLVERQSYQYITYHVNTYHKKGRYFWQDDSDHFEIVARHNSDSQINTGYLSTGKEGQLAIKAEHLDVKSGAEIHAGAKGITWDVDYLSASPTLNQTVERVESSAGRVSITHHVPRYTIKPALVQSEGGMKGRLGTMDLESTHLIVEGEDQNIELHVDHNANLLARQVTESSGPLVSQQGKATVIQELFQPKALPCAFIALKGKVILTVGGKLYGVAPQFHGRVIDLDATEHDITSLLMVNKLIMTSRIEGMFSTQTTTSSQETPSMIPALFNGEEIHIRGGKGKFEGVTFKGTILHDHTIEGLILAPLIREFHYRQQTLSESPLASSDVGCEGWYEAMLPTVLQVEKVVHAIDDNPMRFFSEHRSKGKTTPPMTLPDGTQRFLHTMPGIDNACGFYSLLTGHPDFNPDNDNPRHVAVQKLLEGLQDPILQPQICALLAPEIQEILKAGFFKSNSESERIFDNTCIAQSDVDEAVQTANTTLGVAGKTDEAILAYTAETLEAEGGNPDFLADVQEPVRQASKKLTDAEDEAVAFSYTPQASEAFINDVVGRPLWELGYGSEVYAQLHNGDESKKPSGAMDALALALGVNLEVYRKVENKKKNTFKIKQVHKKIVSPDAPTRELFHTLSEVCLQQDDPSKKVLQVFGHFDRLELTPPASAPGIAEGSDAPNPEDEGVIKLDSVVWDKNRTEIIGKFAETTYQLRSRHTEWANHEQVIPDEALVVVALGIAMMTQGVGGKLFSSLVSTTTGGTMVATSTGMAMASIGFTSICTQFGTSVLRDGDPMAAAASLFTDRYLRSLGTDLLTGGGGGANIQGFTQRLMANGLRAVVKAGVSAVIEKQDLGESLKSGVANAVIDTVSASIAEKIGKAAGAKVNPLSPVEHKLAHFALGAGMGAAMGAVAGHDNLLRDAITSGAGAVIAETIAESLVDREQMAKEARRESQQEGQPFDEKAFYDAYRAKLQPYIDISRLATGSVIAALGYDPSYAITTATNALENNYAGMEEYYTYYFELSEDERIAINESIADTAVEMWENPEETAKELALATIPYGGIAERLYLGDEVGLPDYLIETGILFFGPIKGGIKTGGKFIGKVATKFSKKMAERIEKRALKQASHTAETTAKKMAERTQTLEALDLSKGTNLLSKDQPWTIRSGQEWKRKIFGKAQHTGDDASHAIRSYREAISAAKRDEVESVFLNRGYKKATGEVVIPNRRPDVAIVYKDGKLDAVEVMSKTDIKEALRLRNDIAMDQLPKHRRGDIDIKLPTKEK